jgi:Lrp/AsnC family transcriptional regulator for asnA, asnC and gidA
MVIAFVLCGAQAGKERYVLEKLLELKEVDEASIVYGEYDVIAKVKLDDLKMLDTFIVDKIRSIGEIQVTSTMISSE